MLSGLREALVTGSQRGSFTAGPCLLIYGMKAEEKDIVTFQSTFLWWNWGGRRWRAVSPLQWAAVTPHNMCSVRPLRRRGHSRVGSRYGYCSSYTCLLVSLGPLNVCFTEQTVWIQDLKRPIYDIYLCLCCGKMLHLGVSVYLLGFICTCLIFGTIPILIPV